MTGIGSNHGAESRNIDGTAAVRLKIILKGKSELLRSLGIPGGYQPIPDAIRTTWGDEIDLLAFAGESRKRHLLGHVEIQTTKDPEMSNRMLARYVAIWSWTNKRRKFADAHIRQTVVYVGSARWKPTTRIDEFNLRFSHGFIDARDLDPEPLIDSDNLGDVAFAVLCRDGKRSGVRKAFDRIAAAPVAERTTALATLSKLSDLRGAGERVRSMIGKMADCHAS